MQAAARSRRLAQQQRVALPVWYKPPRHVVPALLVAYAALLPRELQLDIGGAALFVYRLLLLALIPFSLSQIISSRFRAHFMDLVAAITSIWFIIALAVTDSVGVAMVRGSSLAIDLGLAYLVGRVAIRNSRDFQAFVVAFLPGLLATAAILIFESVGQQIVLRPAIAAILNQPAPPLFEEIRFGLLRALGPFPHPILGGVFLASFLPIAWFAARSNFERALGIAVAASMIFTVSSTAILNFFFCAGLIATYVFRRITGAPVFLLAGIWAIVFAVVISQASSKGLFPFLIANLTLDASTGYWRIAIWDYAGAEALNHPIFGIGNRDWIRPSWMRTDSVDAHFLLLAMRYGLISGVGFFLLLTGSALTALSKRTSTTIRDHKIGIALCFSLLSVTFSGFSVYLWEGLGAWMVMLCGMAVSLGSSPDGLPRRGGAKPVAGRSLPQGSMHSARHVPRSTSVQR